MALRCFVAATGGDTGFVLGYGRGGRAELLSACGAAAERSTVPWTSNSFLGRALKADVPVLEAAATGSNGDGRTAPGRNGDVPTAAWRAVAAPILGPLGPLGAIYAGFEPPSELDPVQLRWTAGAYARLTALCMEERGGVASALRSSGIDRLTGCLTYERTLEMLRAEVERSRRHGHPLSCGFLDLDDFKAVNESVGHIQGNAVLEVVGTALRSAARPYDGIGRFGGDEFVIVLPETGAPAARRAVDRMRLRITAVVEEATGILLESSAGIAELSTQGSMLSLLEAADNALQDAKAQGESHHGGRTRPGRLAGLVERTRAAIRPSAPAGTDGAGGRGE